MKTIIAIILLVPCIAFAQTSSPSPALTKEQIVERIREAQERANDQREQSLSGKSKPSVSLEVKNTAAGNKSSSSWETDWGSYIRDYQRTITLVARVSTVSSTPFTALVKWRFLENTNGGAEVASNSATVNFNGTGFQEIPMTATGSQHIENYQALGIMVAGENSRPRSWIVQVYIDGRLAAYQVSNNNSELTAIASTPDKSQPSKTPAPQSSSGPSWSGFGSSALDQRPTPYQGRGGRAGSTQ